jgi:hypothetical protein
MGFGAGEGAAESGKVEERVETLSTTPVLAG